MNKSNYSLITLVISLKKHNVKIIDDNCSVLPRDNYNLVLKGEEVNIRDEFEFIPEDNRGFFKVYDKKKERTKNVNCDIIPTNKHNSIPAPSHTQGITKAESISIEVIFPIKMPNMIPTIPPI